MNLNQFKESLSNPKPDNDLSSSLQALWHDANGDWEGAHILVQADQDRDESWVHAYLHRKEGDLPNASYWYARAKKPISKISLDAEWDDIAEVLLLK